MVPIGARCALRCAETTGLCALAPAAEAARRGEREAEEGSAFSASREERALLASQVHARARPKAGPHRLRLASLR
jgi:hypothetical protein